MQKLILFLLLIPFTAAAQTDSIAHGLYKWKQPASLNRISSVILFEGKTHDFEWMQMKANAFTSPKEIKQKVAADEELLLIVKTGILKFRLKDSLHILVPGSVVLLMPGEAFSINSYNKSPCSFYTMRYRSKLPVNKLRADTTGGSLVIDWNNVPVKPNDRGSRRDLFDRPTAMARRFEMHVTTLKDGYSSHAPHTHLHEEIVLNIDNDSEMLIGNKKYNGQTGDFYFLTSGILHGVKNDGKGECSYFAFRFE